MKRTELEKNLGARIKNRSSFNEQLSRPGNDSANPVDKREQRKLDQAMGLVPFAVKINIDLVQRIQDVAKEKQKGINEVVSELLQKGLDS